jgi:hypothetical protein
VAPTFLDPWHKVLMQLYNRMRYVATVRVAEHIDIARDHEVALFFKRPDIFSVNSEDVGNDRHW